MLNEASILIVGIGSAHGDDQIGWRVADEVAALSSASSDRRINVHKAKSPLDLLNWLDEDAATAVDRLLICDACQGLADPGSVRCWNWPTSELEDVRFSGSHDFGLPSVLRLAEKLGRIPPCVAVWGIQIAQVRAGANLSLELSRIPRRVAGEMLQSVETSFFFSKT